MKMVVRSLALLLVLVLGSGEALAQPAPLSPKLNSANLWSGTNTFNQSITAMGAGNVATSVTPTSDNIAAFNSALTNPTRTTNGLTGNITVTASTGTVTTGWRGVLARASISATSTQNITTQPVMGILAEVQAETGALGTISAPAMAIGLNAYNAAAPSTGATIANLYGIRGNNLGISGGGPITSFAGIALPQLIGATNSTALLLGTVTIPSGNWAINDQTGYPSKLSGALTLSGLSTTPGSKQPLCIDTSTGAVYKGTGGAC